MDVRGERCANPASRDASGSCNGSTSDPPTTDQAYFRRRGVQPFAIRPDIDATLIIPLVDVDAIQRIHEDGTTRFLSGGAKADHFAAQRERLWTASLTGLSGVTRQMLVIDDLGAFTGFAAMIGPTLGTGNVQIFARDYVTRRHFASLPTR